jgi:hypothetical protein
MEEKVSGQGEEAKESEGVGMEEQTDLQILMAAYDKIGIVYVVKTSPGLAEKWHDKKWSYVFLSGLRQHKEFTETSLNELQLRHAFIEFSPDGKLASY